MNKIEDELYIISIKSKNIINYTINDEIQIKL